MNIVFPQQFLSISAKLICIFNECQVQSRYGISPLCRQIPWYKFTKSQDFKFLEKNRKKSHLKSNSYNSDPLKMQFSMVHCYNCFLLNFDSKCDFLNSTHILSHIMQYLILGSRYDLFFCYFISIIFLTSTA